MADPRLTPARPDLAAKHLEGKVQAERFVEGMEFEVFDPIAPVRRAPSHDAALDTEALKGERVTIYDRDAEGWAWGQLQSDGYVGWLPDSALVQPRSKPTHKVTALRTFAFPGPSIKLPPTEGLPLGARVEVVKTDANFADHRPAPLSAVAACRITRCERTRFRCGGRKVRRNTLPLGWQECARHRLLRTYPGVARGCRCLRSRDSDMQEAALG